MNGQKRTRSIKDNLPAKRVKFGLTVEIVAVLANAVEACEYTFVVKSLTVDIEERAFGQRMMAAG